MKKKILFIGIDALDSAQVEKYSDYLPNISELRKNGFYTQFESVWPPDSETAWATIYTGWNPTRHGIFQFVDPLQKTSQYLFSERDNSVFRGHTFWDIASKAGKKVCILFPHIGYPSWEVNGVMVTRSSLNTDISVMARDLRERYNFEGLNDVKGLAGHNRREYLDANRRLVLRQLELNLKIIQENDWDLFFTYWSALDLIQHQFWAHCDQDDPTYLGDNPYKNAIRDFYMLHDEVVGQLIAAAGSDIDVIVMSDHGHGMRPVKIFNINRLLRENGLLTIKHGADNFRINVLKRIKKNATDLISRYELGGAASKVLKIAPWTKKVYVSTTDLDWGKTIAYITDMSGIKAYAYGGIQIAKQNLNGQSYENVREKIIDLLYSSRDPNLGNEPLVKWARPREELYDGPYLDEYPDIVFELRPDYGAGWDATGPMFDTSRSHNLYPGSHIGTNAVFAFQGPDKNRILQPPNSAMDIAPTILNLMDLEIPMDIDGRSILK
jgi:predicted AlkP superfamily phosphohydrolase/phosphomutase